MKQRKACGMKNIEFGGQVLAFKLDTGSQANIISQEVYRKLSNVVLHPTKNCLVKYSGEQIKREGEIVMKVIDQDMKFQDVDNGSVIIGKEGCVALGLV